MDRARLQGEFYFTRICSCKFEPKAGFSWGGRLNLPKYKVHRKDDPDDYVIVFYPHYSPMMIKGAAIRSSDKFTWGDYEALKVRRHKEGQL